LAIIVAKHTPVATRRLTAILLIALVLQNC
jgi:hypothetical protein